MRVRLGEKRNPTDFALWKFSPEDSDRQMEWESPWGLGFPGWHIECSAMSAKYLGPYFDIHCGGEDHINVHHPNEIAQTQACYGTRLANFWMHGYFLQLESGRMGKSLGNFITVQDLVDQGYDPLAYRYLCLNAHYRSKLTFNLETLDAAVTAFDRLRNLVYRWGEPGEVDEEWMDRFVAQVNDDINVPRGLAVAWDLTRSELPDGVKKATILRFDDVLGLGLGEWKPAEVPENVAGLVQAREDARAARDWARADALRDEIAEAGWEVRDTSDGAVVRKL